MHDLVQGGLLLPCVTVSRPSWNKARKLLDTECTCVTEDIVEVQVQAQQVRFASSMVSKKPPGHGGATGPHTHCEHQGWRTMVLRIRGESESPGGRGKVHSPGPYSHSSRFSNSGVGTEKLIFFFGCAGDGIQGLVRAGPALDY
jgi:hypothetical protein